MPYQVDGACYPTEAAAVSAIVARSVGSVVDLGGSPHVVTAPSVVDGVVTFELQPIAGGTPVTQAIAIAPQPCQLMGWEDGLALGWAVAGVWFAVFAVMVLRRGVPGA